MGKDAAAKSDILSAMEDLLSGLAHGGMRCREAIPLLAELSTKRSKKKRVPASLTERLKSVCAEGRDAGVEIDHAVDRGGAAGLDALLSPAGTRPHAVSLRQFADEIRTNFFALELAVNEEQRSLNGAVEALRDINARCATQFDLLLPVMREHLRIVDVPAAPDWVRSDDASKWSGMSTDSLRKRASRHNWETTKSGTLSCYKRCDLEKAWPHRNFRPDNGGM